MVRIWVFGTGHNSMTWPVVLAIVYGVLFLMTAAFATYFAYFGRKPYAAQVSERHPNKRWIKPLLPVILILLPALLWPLVMVGVLLFVAGILCFDRQGGIWKNMRGAKREKDVEMGQLTDDGRLDAQASSQHCPPVTADSDNTTTTITEPPPAYNPHDAHRGQREESAH